MTKTLLELGADPLTPNENGTTPLMVATGLRTRAPDEDAGAVPVLMAAGANIEIWNRKNHLDWTPLRIATGVHRGMNLRASPETAAAIQSVMETAGVSTIVEPEAFVSGETR